ncbi:armadillo-type protein [Sporodiniella umbellata]|nr:armadillo-type protein [Sporodiniella umbellata]
MSTDQFIEKQIVDLTRELQHNSSDDISVVSTLVKRALLYESLNQFQKCQDDIREALRRDPNNEEIKSLLVRITTSQSSLTDEKDNEDPLVTKFQILLTNLDTTQSSSVRSFVSSADFISVLTACGIPDSPPRVKSLAFMILTQLFNPSSESAKQYPLTFVIEKCAACFSHCIDQGKNDSKLLAYQTLLAIFQTSMTVGAAILCQEGIVEEMIDTVEFEILPVQIAVAEVLNIASSDQSCRKLILKYATDWLVKMVGQTKTDAHLKAAAGTALTKLKAQSDLPSDTSSVPDGSADNSLNDLMRKMHLTDDTLADSLKQVIKSKSADANLILNALEGLAYSSLKPEIKESLGEDEEFLKCLSTLAVNTVREESSGARNPMLFGLGTIFANVTMYKPVLDEKQKQIKRLRDLADAKQRKATGLTETVNGDDPREDDAAVEGRIKKAIANGVSVALIVLSKNSSTNIRAVAAQTYLNIVTPQATRGQLLQQGIVRGLLLLSRDEGTSGIVASQALAKLAITADPRLAFQGDILLDLVKPFLNLCKDSSQLRQFEALMAMTNLASVDDRVRLLIENADGMSIFENLQLSSNDMVQRAATEMVCNMTFCEPVFDRYSDPEKSQNRIRLLMILSDHEDPATRRASSGALAILANSPSTCKMILNVEKCFERMARWVDEEETMDVKHRGIEIMRLLLLSCGKEVTQGMAGENIDKKLVAITKSCNVQVIRTLAIEVLKLCVDNACTQFTKALRIKPAVISITFSVSSHKRLGTETKPCTVCKDLKDETETSASNSFLPYSSPSSRRTSAFAVTMRAEGNPRRSSILALRGHAKGFSSSCPLLV